MSTALHILIGHHNVVGWWLVVIYLRTPPIQCYLECSGRVAYIVSQELITPATTSTIHLHLWLK